ncbi:MAG: hypothetical protein MUC28_03530, partial [Planctomycetes bacterium]|nr:hypothetical protein [Planctomycetota bacterium]
MINTINTIFILLLLFFVLGKSADKIVYCTRIIVEKMGVPVVFLGAILGLFTSLPETAIGVNALLNNIEGLALGNLLGGIFVLLCFVLGASLVLNRKTSTDGKITNIIPIFLFFFFPFALGFDGRLNYVDALIIIAGYLAILVFLYKKDANFSLAHVSVSIGDRMAKIWLYLIISVVVIILSSNLIVREAT